MAGKTTENLTLFGIVGCLGVVFLGLCVALGGGVLYLSRRGVFTPSEGPPAPVASPTSPPVAPRVDPIPRPPIPGVPQKPPPTAPIGPVARSARVVAVTGSLQGRVVTACTLTVAPPAEADTNCRAEVRCDGLLLYGLTARTGFVPCRIGDDRVSAADVQTTAADGDASLVVDTDARTLTLRDDESGPFGAYTLEATY